MMLLANAILFQPFVAQLLLLLPTTGSVLAWIALLITLVSTIACEITNADLFAPSVNHDDGNAPLVLPTIVETIANAVWQVVNITSDRFLGWFSAAHGQVITAIDELTVQLHVLSVITETITNAVQQKISNAFETVFGWFSAVYRDIITIIDDLALQVHDDGIKKKKKKKKKTIFALPMSETYLQIIPRAPRTLAISTSCREIVLRAPRTLSRYLFRAFTARPPPATTTTATAKDNLLLAALRMFLDALCNFLRMFLDALCTVYHELVEVIGNEFKKFKAWVKIRPNVNEEEALRAAILVLAVINLLLVEEEVANNEDVDPAIADDDLEEWSAAFYRELGDDVQNPMMELD